MRAAGSLGIPNLPTLVIGAVAIAAVYVWLRGIKGAAADVANVVVKSAEGVVIGVGTAIGIPETDQKACEDYIAAGDWWNASFYCPAGTFLKSAAGAVFSSSGEVIGYAEPGDEPELIMLN